MITAILITAVISSAASYWFAYHHGYYNATQKALERFGAAADKPAVEAQAQQKTERAGPIVMAASPGGTQVSLVQAQQDDTLPTIPRPQGHGRPGVSQPHVRQPRGDSDKIQ